MFKCETPSVSAKGQNVNYRQRREGSWYVGKKGRETKGRFQCELRPEPQQEGAGFKDLRREQWGRGKGKSLAAWKEEQIKNVPVL